MDGLAYDVLFIMGGRTGLFFVCWFVQFVFLCRYQCFSICNMIFGSLPPCKGETFHLTSTTGATAVASIGLVCPVGGAVRELPAFFVSSPG